MASKRLQPHRRAALQAQLGLLQRQAAEIAHRLNFSSAISMLNSDVLLKIFQLLCPTPALPHTGNLKKPRATYPTTDIRHVSQVCHEWRQVALESSSLWVTLDCSQEPVLWLLELIQRSKGSPVNIFLNLDLKYDHSKLLAIATKLPVAGSITLFIGWRPTSAPDEVVDILRKALQDGSAVNIYDPGHSSSKLLPLTIKPRALDLRGPVTDLTHPCFAQLQELSIVNPQISFPSSEWVTIVRGLPLLTHLRLDEAINDRDHWQAPVVESLSKTFRLPRLRSLSLIVSKPYESGVDQFLSCVVPSKPYALKLTGGVVPRSRPADLLFKAIESWCSTWIEGVDHKIHVLSSYRKLSIFNVDMPDDYTFRITIDWRCHRSEAIPEIEGKVLQAMMPILQHTVELVITHDWYKHSASICPSMFWTPFTSVRKLCISNHPEDISQNQGLLVFLDALANDLVQSPNAPLPNIRCLALRRVSQDSASDEEHPVTAKLEALITLGRQKGWILEELQLRQSPTAIGGIWKRRFGGFLTVSVFDPTP